MLPLVADQSAGRGPVGRIVQIVRVVPDVLVAAVAKVVVHPGQGSTQVLQIEVHLNAAQAAGAMAHRVAAQPHAAAREQLRREPPSEQQRWVQPELPAVLERLASQQQALEQEPRRQAEPRALQSAEAEQASPPLPETARQPWARQAQPASAQRPLAAELPAPEPQQRAPRSRALEAPPAAVEPLGPPLPSHLCPPWLVLRRPLLHPRRLEGACEPSRLRPPESSSSASFFLERRTRAIGR